MAFPVFLQCKRIPSSLLQSISPNDRKIYSYSSRFLFKRFSNPILYFDNTNPILTSVKIESDQDEDDPTLAIPNSTVTLTFIADSELKDPPDVTISGRLPDNLTGSNGNRTWTATTLMLDTDDDSGDRLPFTISYTDLAGNEGTDVDQTGTTGDEGLDARLRENLAIFEEEKRKLKEETLA